MTSSRQHGQLVRRVEGLLLPLMEEMARLDQLSRERHGDGLQELGIRVSVDGRRRDIPREVIKLHAWCSPAQRHLLDVVSEFTGVHLDEHLTLEDAEAFLTALRDPNAMAESDDAPL